MDPYEILGIRTSAGGEEIELAYKGRRSQYHPDRYANSDAETLDWATSKMQEVNQAYAALRDPVIRARVDEEVRTKSARPAGPADAFRAPKPEPSYALTLVQALDGLALNGEPLERIFIAPRIPHKKLAGALESYGQGLQPQDVVVLIDDTLFGGAREGVLITEAQIRCKAVFQPVEIRLLGVLSVITTEGKYVYINGKRFADLNMPNKCDLKALFKAVSRYMQQSR
ncbi:DnaJ domain-containing protein [Xanthomonas campestris pv. campestris]|nr:DnaJ domain-containing protein [Xanthomonas campestris pv. campestris]WDL24077.1 DnaJ domain-containing protein [Xanthomonas campestris pv. campestris]WDL27924.1 DnaJ domain-containing protein [Xanthomonas campestris pv. campestris]WDL32251.1 DnaJ domain-containing protein [Xanthomonas campestris pv. campestris]WDL36096.1 DnaJ domain-containing protein [Xanthomonas campestris pv. campestris]